MIISRTPYRISFFGGGTDYPAWYRLHGGAVLSTTIDKYCYISCRYLPPFNEHQFRVVYSHIESCREIQDIAHPAVRETLKFMAVDRGLEIHHDGDLPARSGMGSSSAFTVGLLHVLYALRNGTPSKHQLATESIHIEQELIKETVGSQDQVSAAFGGFNHISFAPGGDVAVRPMVLSRGRTEELNAHLMLFYTGIKRTAADIAVSYAQDLESRKRPLGIMSELVNEAVSVLGNGQDIRYFGRLLNEAWQAKRTFSPIVSNSRLEEIYREALAAGALGGKLLGAGGGGFMLLFVPPEDQESVRTRLNRLVNVSFKFETGGSQIIFSDIERDYAAQEVERTIHSFREQAHKPGTKGYAA